MFARCPFCDHKKQKPSRVKQDGSFQYFRYYYRATCRDILSISPIRAALFIAFLRFLLPSRVLANAFKTIRSPRPGQPSGVFSPRSQFLIVDGDLSQICAASLIVTAMCFLGALKVFLLVSGAAAGGFPDMSNLSNSNASPSWMFFGASHGS